MDHIPTVLNTSHPLPEVPYLRDTRFASYHFQNQKIHEHGPEEQEQCDSALFQQCLFFGTLVNVLGVYDIPVLESDFIACYQEGQEIVTTRLLADYLAAWVVKASRQSRHVLTKPLTHSSNPIGWTNEALQTGIIARITA